MKKKISSGCLYELRIRLILQERYFILHYNNLISLNGFLSNVLGFVIE
jgi:hypothetical protein